MKRRRYQHRTSGKSSPSRLLTIFGLLVIAVGFGFYWADTQLSPLDPYSKAKILVDIPSHASAGRVATILADSGVVRSRYSVLIVAAFGGWSSRLKPGVYRLSPRESPEQIVSMLAEGTTATVRVTFPEGFTLRQDASRLAERHVTDEQSFLEMATRDGKTFHCVDGFTPPSNNLEGYLFPDTYDFDPGISNRQIIQEMLDHFDKQVLQAEPHVRDWRKAVILGSLIEREAEVEQDRPLIAAVMYNRLKIGMPLQIDATVEYALPEHKARLMYSDLKTVSPYNTYLHHGLPPGPICSPGLPSIEAALHPAPVGYLYYVQGLGRTHIFSRTLAEQDKNIAAVRSVRVPS